MGEAYDEHFAWLRCRNTDGWSSWWRQGRFNHRMDAEKFLADHMSEWERHNKDKSISGVALPVGLSPVERAGKENV